MTNVEIKYQICVRLRDEKIYGYALERTIINFKIFYKMFYVINDVITDGLFCANFPVGPKKTKQKTHFLGKT